MPLHLANPSPYTEGYLAWKNGSTAHANPYWPNYGKPNDSTPDDERILARLWVDGYTAAIKANSPCHCI